SSSRTIDQDNIHTQIETALNSRGWSNLTSFARMARIKPSDLFDIKYKHLGVSLSSLLKICEAAEVSLQELLGERLNSQAKPKIDKPARPLRAKWHDSTFTNAIR